MAIAVPQRLNIAAALADGNVIADRGNSVAIICGDRQVTYSELVELSSRVGSGLSRLGIQPEQRVLMALPDSVEFVAAYLGIMRLGAVAVPLNTLLTSDDYGYILADSRAAAIIGDAATLAQVAVSETEWLRHAVTVGQPPSPPPDGRCSYTSFDDLLRAGQASFEPMDTAADDAAFWLYSSGTTGFPKAVVHLHQDVLFSMQYGEGVLEADPACRMLASSKLFFAYALGCCLHIPLLAGGTTILNPERAIPAALAALAIAERPTHFFSVPTFYAAALHAGVPAGAYDSVRFCVSAGEALPAHVYDQWLAATGKEIVEHIGSTEHIYAFISNQPGQVRPGSAGRPVPGIEARLVDAQLQDVPAGESGELLIKSGSNAIGYWNKRAQTKHSFAGDWLRTGDMMSMDEDGYFWYQGRLNDMLKVSGIWVSPIEVEVALGEHPAVGEAAVVGAPDADGLIKPKAFVVRSAPVEAEELQIWVKHKLAPYKYPRWIEFVEALPRTATGKVQRYQLRSSGS
ncbi:MAG: benzoate-CoA ligase family protein [Chloroflexi bacterium]|nr:benzoate-CoA ligase family protein [Chloroflexota bacterium]